MSVEGPDFPMEKDCLDDEDDDSSPLKLVDLPVEVFLYICSYIDTSTLVHSLGLVCKQFHEILKDKSLWKVRISQIWPNTRYPVLPSEEDDETFWKKSCVAVENGAVAWKNQDSIETFLLKGHSTVTDGLLLLHRAQSLICGGRDHSLTWWYASTPDCAYSPRVVRTRAHNGWIWDIVSMGDIVYSCSWDQTLKSWDLSCELSLVRTFTMNTINALLCASVCTRRYIVATGSYCRKVLIWDPRFQEPIAKYQTHQRAVLTIAMNDNYVFSGSEDRTVCVWDQRTRKVLKTIEISKTCYPLSISLDKRSLYIGDNSGNLHVLDCDKNFEAVKHYTNLHSKDIRGLHCDAGAIITGSIDKTVKIFSPTDPPRLVTSLSYAAGDIANLDYLNGVVAVSGTLIQVWRPKTGKITINHQDS